MIPSQPILISDGLTQQRLRELLDYNPETGEFFWKGNCKSCPREGHKAGYRIPAKKNHYIRIQLLGVVYMAHRLAFLYTTGVFPSEQVDHINGDGTDNRACNLRLVTSTENNRNSGMRWNNQTGVTGVEWHKRDETWSARIKVDGKSIHLGCFSNKEDAIRARLNAQKFYGFHENHGKRRTTATQSAECEVA